VEESVLHLEVEESVLHLMDWVGKCAPWALRRSSMEPPSVASTTSHLRAATLSRLRLQEHNRGGR
jgi:hypothetical protein